jgi:uncharacterized protein (TIGR02001 family)
MPHLPAHSTGVLAWLVAMVACAAHAEEAQEATIAPADQFKFIAGGTLMSDYIYRGISYSGHQPSVAAYIDAQQGWLYFYTNFNSVKFSTSPAVEVTVAVGARPTVGPFEFDIGAAYYYYPGEIGPDLSNYWESHVTMSHKLTEKLSWGPTIAYAPDVWQTGAWGFYFAGTVSYDLPSEFLPPDLTWTLSLDAGRWLFGPTTSGGGVSAAGGGLPLPDYTNWRVGLTFNYRVFKLGLNYTDTNLSHENCFIMTGDIGAIPGGVANPGNNPLGFRSRLCGAIFSATLGFEINPATLGR